MIAADAITYAIDNDSLYVKIAIVGVIIAGIAAVFIAIKWK